MKAVHFVLVGGALLSSGCTVVHRPPYYGGSAPATYRAPVTEQYVEVCHKDRDTLSLPESAADAHLRHGDYYGPCQGYDAPRHAEPRDNYPPPGASRDHYPPRHPEPARDSYPPRYPEPARDRYPPSQPPARAEQSLTLCYNGTTLQVSESAAKDYMRRGAYHGACALTPPRHQPEPARDRYPPRYPEPARDRHPPSQPPARVEQTLTLCYNGTTLQVSESAAKDYMRKGARHGTCPATPMPHKPAPVQQPVRKPVEQPAYTPPPVMRKPEPVRKPVGQPAYSPPPVNRKPEPAQQPVRKPVPVMPQPSAPERQTTICHKGKTLSLPESAIPGHLQHGDQLGSCP